MYGNGWWQFMYPSNSKFCVLFLCSMSFVFFSGEKPGSWCRVVKLIRMCIFWQHFYEVYKKITIFDLVLFLIFEMLYFFIWHMHNKLPGWESICTCLKKIHHFVNLCIVLNLFTNISMFNINIMVFCGIYLNWQ